MDESEVNDLMFNTCFQKVNSRFYERKAEILV